MEDSQENVHVDSWVTLFCVLGEIVESQGDEGEQEKAVTSQLAYLRLQLDEKRRHIEAEKHRAQAEWEDQRRRLGQTAFWYVIGKAQGGQPVEERPGSEVRLLLQGMWNLKFLIKFLAVFFLCSCLMFGCKLDNLLIVDIIALVRHYPQTRPQTCSLIPKTSRGSLWPSFLTNHPLPLHGHHLLTLPSLQRYLIKVLTAHSSRRVSSDSLIIPPVTI